MKTALFKTQKHTEKLFSPLKLFFAILLIFSGMLSLNAGEVDENIPVISINPTSKTVTEGNSGTKNVSVTVSLDKCPIYADIKLKYATRNGSAKSGSDYIQKNGTFVFNKGASSCSKSFSFQIKGDTNVESNQYFYIDFSNNGTNPNQKFTSGTSLTSKITIKNDDQNVGADLRVTKSLSNSGDGDKVYGIGEVITFKIRAKNNGPDDSTIKVVDTLPAGLSLVSITPNITNNFSCNTGTKSCTGSHIFTKGQSVLITVRAKASAQGNYKNVAVISDKNGNQDTINTKNNTNSASVLVVPGGVEGVHIDKSVNDNRPDLNDYVNFTLKVTNQGLDKRLELRDKFPTSSNDDWSTTGNAFTDISWTIVDDPKNKATCEMRTHNSNPYLYCDTVKKYTNGEFLTVNVRAKVIRNNRICNTAHAYKYYWKWKDSDTICLDVYGSYPPTLAPIPDKTAYIGEYFWYRVSNYANDPDGDPLTFTAAPLPPGLILQNGVIKKPPTEDGANQTYPVTVTVTDHPANGYPSASASQTFNIKVEYPPVVANNNVYLIESNSSSANDSLSGNIITDNDSQSGKDRGYKIKVIATTPQTFPEGTLTWQSDGSFIFDFQKNFIGQVSFDYTIEDTRGVKDTATVTLTVSTDFEDGFQPFVLINPTDTQNVLGNFVIAGNTIECISNTDKNFNGTCTDDSSKISNDYVTKYIDIDGDSSTWNSSSSYVDIPSSFDQDDKAVLWAGLFWQGRFTTDAQYDESGTNRLIRYGTASGLETSITTQDISNFNANKIKLKINSGTYNEVTATTLFSNRNYGGVSYAAFSDVTNIIKNAITNDGRYTFTVADLPTAEGWERDPGLYGGWSLVVIYAEDFRGKVRNISVYSGYDQIEGDAAGGVTDDTELTISGFKLPAFDKINSTLALFSGEGEYPLGAQADKFDRVLLSDDGTNYDYPNLNTANKDNTFDAILTGVERDGTNPDNNLQNNNAGLDIDYFDVSDLMSLYRDQDQNISSVNIKWETNLDTVNPSMIVFATELYVPKLCYDYSYKQNGITFSEDNNGTEKPYITGERLAIGDPITVELYIRNEEASDATLKGVTFDVLDINTTQAPYAPESTYVTYPGSYTRTSIPDNVMDTSPSYIKDIPLGGIGARDSLYIDYDLDTQKNEIDMPLSGRVNFTLDLLGGISYDLSIYLETMTVCGNDRYAYYPNYDIFNIHDKALSSDNSADNYYDLPTQIVKRVGDYSVRAYQNDMESSKKVTTLVGVELVDVGKYHDVNASCFEPDNVLSPRVWIAFENNTTNVDFTEATIEAAITQGRTSDLITAGTPVFDKSNPDASLFYSKARENIAFRISYLTLGDEGDVLELEEKECPGGKSEPCYSVTNFSDLSSVNLGNGAGNCIVDMASGNDKIPEYCGSTALIDGDQLPECLECVYGYNLQYVCSRDNFAIRPKSFRITLSDQNQTDDTQPKTEIGKNNDTTAWNLVTGYDYYIDINATDYLSDASTPGYFAYFDQGGEDGNKSFGLVWQDVSGHTSCIDEEDSNSSTQFYNGATSLDVSHDQIGQYHLSMVDKIYTKVDWNPKYMGHQQASHFLSGTDCESGSSVSLTEGTATGISNTDLSNVNGCEIASDLTSDLSYTDMVTQFYPYTFNVASLLATAGPTDKAFVYIDSPSTDQAENTNMSYNMNGTYFAANYDAGTQLSNFTDGCWAEDTVMQLDFNYNHTQPANTPFLSYSLQDINTTNTSRIYRPTSGTGLEVIAHNSISTPFAIDQLKTFYDQEMGGAITMDLGFNFNRQNDLTLEPRFITFNDFNISYKVNPATLYADGESNYVIKGVKTLTRDITFLYGRAKPSKTLYDDISGDFVITPISTVSYCALGVTECQNRGFPLMDAQTDQSDWWLTLAHDTSTTPDNDGNITLILGSGEATVAPAAVTITTGATNNSVTVTKNNGAAVPMTAVIDLTTGTDKWLIYNPYSATAWPSPFYRVRFIGVSDWAGHGDTGHVVGGDANVKKNQRLGW